MDNLFLIYSTASWNEGGRYMGLALGPCRMYPLRAFNRNMMSARVIGTAQKIVSTLGSSILKLGTRSMVRIMSEVTVPDMIGRM